jgi:hypothetical protein
MQYCTVAEVKDVLQLFKQDFENANITDTEIEQIITEATECIRFLVSQKYDLESIEDLSELPPALNYASKLKSCFLMLERFGPIGIERNKAIYDFLQDSYKFWESAIEKGFLLDTDGKEVSVQRYPKLLRTNNYAKLNRILHPRCNYNYANECYRRC